LTQITEGVSGLVADKAIEIAFEYRNQITGILALAPSTGLLVNEYFNLAHHGLAMFSKPHDYVQLAISVLV
jgi:hypothetical protein